MGKKTAILTLAIVTAAIMAYGLVVTKNNFVSIGAGSVVSLPFLVGMTYDPDPRRSRRKSRRGGLPKSLIKKYGISKKAWAVFRGAGHRVGRYDPRRPQRRSMARGYGSVGHKPFRLGSRGGVAWSGARKLRYDPTRHARLKRYGGRIGRGIEGTINRWGSWLGALFGLGYGVYRGVTLYNSAEGFGKHGTENYLKTIVGGTLSNGEVRGPEIAHLWQNTYNADGSVGWTPDRYLRYKFLGYSWWEKDEAGNPKEVYDVSRSTWGLPFWLGVGAWAASKIVPKLLGKFARGRGSQINRILKPIGKIGKGVAIVSGIGALALPNPNPRTTFGQPMPPSPANYIKKSNVINESQGLAIP